MKKLLNRRTGIVLGIAAIVLIIAIIVSTSFTSAMNLDQAKDIAKAYVPENANFVGSEEEDRYFEVAFYDEENKEGFEVKVNKETSEVKKVESQLSNDEGGREIIITEEEAKEVVRNRFSGLTSVSVVLTRDNGLYEYEATFKANEFYGDADINAENGAILDSVIKYGTVTTIPTDTSKDSEIISYEQAKALILEEAGGGVIRDIDLDRENKEYFYEIELHIDGMERDYKVNALTSEIFMESEHPCYFEEHHQEDPYEESVEYVENSDDNVDNFSPLPSDEVNEQGGFISEAEAKDIVWAKIPGAEIVEFYLERDDGIEQYEGTAYLDGYEYEFEINAASGVMINWERERIEYDEWDD